MKTKELKKQQIKHITDAEKIRKAAIEGAEDQDATYFASITDVFKHYEQRLKDKDEAHKKELGEAKKVDENTSDGYHTFRELYEHRNRLFIAWLNELQNRNHASEGNEIYANVWKSKKHSDGTSWDGWFTAGTDVGDNEQVTYHLPIDLWDALVVPVLDKAPKWDGQSQDVLERLKQI